jgi:predicted RNA binding protein YcfA (HicA-like mRNA interferase family)
MPKLPAVKPRRIIQFLERHGFVIDHVSGSHSGIEGHSQPGGELPA